MPLQRLYVAAGGSAQCGQCHAVRKTQFQFPPRHRPGRRHHPGADGGSCDSIRFRPNHSGIHHLRQGQPRQGQHGSRRARERPAHGGELFNVMAGVSMIHVPYRGQGPALSDLLGGQVQVLFAATPGTVDYVRTGKLRGLPSPPRRGGSSSGAAAGRDFVPGYDASQWYGLGAPKNTPADIIDRLNREINAALADPAMKARFADSAASRSPARPRICRFHRCGN